MLVRVTDKCSMGCKHCFIEATPHKGHMTLETFKASLAFSKSLGDYTLLVSGGEPTEHPQLEEFLRVAKAEGFVLFLLTNGSWLPDLRVRNAMLTLCDYIQVTNDLRYYPREVKEVVHPKISFTREIRQVAPFGRAKTGNIVSTRKTPLCFNLRSFTRAYGGDLHKALQMHRFRNGNCTPSVNIDGSIAAGEAVSCCTFGTVRASVAELGKALAAMRCNKCGLCDNLTAEQRAAIGE